MTDLKKHKGMWYEPEFHCTVPSTDSVLPQSGKLSEETRQASTSAKMYYLCLLTTADLFSSIAAAPSAIHTLKPCSGKTHLPAAMDVLRGGWSKAIRCMLAPAADHHLCPFTDLMSTDDNTSAYGSCLSCWCKPFRNLGLPLAWVPSDCHPEVYNIAA